MKKLLLVSLVLGLIIMTACERSENPIKTLVITGQNNHNWEVSHIAIKQILENSELFTVDVAISPKEGEDMSDFVIDFSSYQVVVVDYNGDMWPEKTRNSFQKYADNGGGIIIYHAADNAFPEWDAFNQICALGGWEGRNEKSGPYVYLKDGQIVKDVSEGTGGSHGDQHEYVLNGYAEHPIVKGLPKHWLHTKDELYDQMRGPGNIKDLLYTAYANPEMKGSGREEPLLFTVDYKNARIFHTMLGHAGESLKNNVAMQCVGFQATLLRAAEWAATGRVTQAVPEDFPTASQTSLRKDYK